MKKVLKCYLEDPLTHYEWVSLDYQTLESQLHSTCSQTCQVSKFKFKVPAENYPFCTIDPNVARINIPDERFNFLCDLYHPKSKVEAQLNITDIAGLVRGASEGKGLGNAFLSHISAVDGMYHVVRAFDDESIIHDEGDVNPVRDLDIIHTEMIKKDQQHLEKRRTELESLISRKPDKILKDEKVVLDKVHEVFEKGLWVKDGDWTGSEIEWLNQHSFLTSKPVVYLVNISEAEYAKKANKHLAAIKEWIDTHGGGPMIPFSAIAEQQCVDAGGKDDKTRADYEASSGFKSAIPRIIKIGYKALRLGHFFTAGEDEVRQWTIRLGWKAPQAAGIIHTDFEKGFICAEIFKFKDLKELGSEKAVKDAGLYRQQGREYEIEDGDICFFKFNVSKGGAKKK